MKAGCLRNERQKDSVKAKYDTPGSRNKACCSDFGFESAQTEHMGMAHKHSERCTFLDTHRRRQSSNEWS